MPPARPDLPLPFFEAGTAFTGAAFLPVGFAGALGATGAPVLLAAGLVAALAGAGALLVAGVFFLSATVLVGAAAFLGALVLAAVLAGVGAFAVFFAGAFLL